MSGANDNVLWKLKHAFGWRYCIMYTKVSNGLWSWHKLLKPWWTCLGYLPSNATFFTCWGTFETRVNCKQLNTIVEDQGIRMHYPCLFWYFLHWFRDSGFTILLFETSKAPSQIIHSTGWYRSSFFFRLVAGHLKFASPQVPYEVSRCKFADRRRVRICGAKRTPQFILWVQKVVTHGTGW